MEITLTYKGNKLTVLNRKRTTGIRAIIFRLDEAIWFVPKVFKAYKSPSDQAIRFFKRGTSLFISNNNIFRINSSDAKITKVEDGDKITISSRLEENHEDETYSVRIRQDDEEEEEEDIFPFDL